MRLIKTKPRYRCDYCSHSGIKSKMMTHEKVCWRNPNRHCDLCNDKGWYEESPVEFYVTKIPCQYCSQYDASKLPPLDETTSEQLTLRELAQASPSYLQQN